VPGATMLGFIVLLLAISQVGEPLLILILIWGGAAWWLCAQGSLGSVPDRLGHIRQHG